ncbi:family 20 glycosylhydrolase [Fulvimonas sp. R45]|uniref:glycoside hydrolase family 20 protein n=1 Tax=Fulvimonas sp. R45 TaxID=3045937 RepID=UPI00265F7E6E|nr:family 20 glycosylhydrolase [Fulvimonas sp. R45]MDO1530092.1 family 20 glycosylhydrolase [Fulvimonas sp. R45]
MSTRFIVLLLGLGLASGACAAGAQLALVPQPRHLVVGTGHFVLESRDAVAAPGDARAQEIARFLRDAVRAQTGIALPPARGGKARIVLRIDPSIAGGDEAYRLDVAPARVLIAAPSDRGLFWGVQTLRQLLPVERSAQVEIPAVRIEDAPAYAWRGVMLDVSRHFYPVSFVEKQLDLLSYYKINTFHWHLTDDQGWRIQIRRYPKLTSIGAWRTEADGTRYGGYYTQAQIREVVDYARKRNITVIPEIEMPGHSVAAIAAYPELSCSGKPVPVATTWGVFSDIDCVGKPATFTFLENVLDEVLPLFPSPYVHIGGDETPKVAWHDCASCQALMHQLGLKDEDGLQSYFIKRIQTYLEGKGKTLVGWDEILEGGADTHAVIEAWRGADEQAKALANGNRVVVAGPFYIDRALDSLTVQDVFRTDIANDSQPGDAKADAAVFVAHRAQLLGAEAPLWSERANPYNAESRLYPRVLAFAENLWRGDAHTDADWADFQQRLQAQYPRLDAWHVAYGPADRAVVKYAIDTADGGGWQLHAQRGFDDLVNRYTVDGSTPTAGSPSFTDSVAVHHAGTLKVVPFRKGLRYDNPVNFTLVDNLATGKPLSLAQPPSQRYAPAGALTDGVLGSGDFRDGQWTGWNDHDIDARIDLQKATAIHSIAVDFLQDTGSRILPPRTVSFQVSGDGQHWTTLQTEQPQANLMNPQPTGYHLAYKATRPLSARYVRVTASRYATVPAGFPDGAANTWLFADEILVK